MNSTWPGFRSYSAASSIVTALLSVSTGHLLATEDPGTLEVYEMATQIGTVARRVVVNEQGRPIQETYYRSQRFSGRGIDESKSIKAGETKIVPYSIRLSSYNESGQQVWEGEYTPEWKLNRTTETTYSGTQRSSIYSRNAEGILTGEARYTNDLAQTTLLYDDSGNLKEIRGIMPADVDFPSGWGESFNGVTCRLLLSRSREKMSEMRFSLTVRNLTFIEREMIDDFTHQHIIPELRDASEKIVPQATEHLRARVEYIAKINGGRREFTRSLAPFQVETFDFGLLLSDWYDKLPAGIYTLTVTRRTDNSNFVLKSEPVEIEILPD